MTIEQGRVVAVTLAIPETGERHTFVRYRYDNDDNLVAVVDALGNPHQFEYEQHHLVRHTDRNGLSFSYEYEQGPTGWRVRHAWGDGGLYDYRFEYLDLLNERRVTDSLGQTSVVSLNDLGLPIAELDPLGGRTTFEYDDAGRTSAVVDPAGRRVEYVHDARGNLLRLVRPDGSAVSTEYENNRPAVITDPNGGQWKQEWDPRGVMLAQTSPLDQTSTYEYDGHGQLIAFTNPRGSRTGVSFDAVGNIAGLTNALGHRTRFDHSILGDAIARVDAEGRRTQYDYDAKGRLTAVTLPSGSTIWCAYDPEDNLTRYVDENGAQTRFEYAGLGELVRRIQPDGQVVEYLHDTEERLVGVRNQRGELYEFRRDALGRVIEEIDFWGQGQSYAYDGSGYLAAKIDSLHRRVDYVCDPLGRVRRTLTTDAAGGTSTLETFDYDANGNLVAAAGADVTVTRRFDAQGQLVSEEQLHASGDRFAVENTYDTAGNRTRRQTSLGNIVDFEYDALEQLSAVRINGGERTRISRDRLGQIAEEELAPGLTSRFAYSTDGLIQDVSVSKDGAALFRTRYEYDRAGNLLGRADTELGIDRFIADPLGRIVEHIDPRGRLARYFHDPAGDLLRTHAPPDAAATAATELRDAWHRDGDYQGTRYRFDRNGNLIGKADAHGRFEFAWDHHQRLASSIRITASGEVRTRYAYDPLGRRVFKETEGRRTWFGWDGDTLAADGASGAPREFVCYPDSFEPLAMLSGGGGDGPEVLRYVNDPNGCPARLIDAAGEVRWAAGYSVWGQVDTTLAAAVANPLRFQGQYFDDETGLHYNRHRYFDPLIGQFISADPLGMEAGENCYRFAPNAWGWTDPLGLTCGPGHVHGNSLKSTKPNHVYVIVDTHTGRLMKPGISGQALLKNGASPRANRQLSALNATQPGRYKAVIVESNVSRGRALEIEQMITDKHAARNAGQMPSPVHQRPSPQVQSREEFLNHYGFTDNTPQGGRY